MRQLLPASRVFGWGNGEARNLYGKRVNVVILAQRDSILQGISRALGTTQEAVLRSSRLARSCFGQVRYLLRPATEVDI